MTPSFKSKVNIYTHFVEFESVPYDHEQILLQLIRTRLLSHKLLREQGRFKEIPDKVYAEKLDNGEKYRFHINFYPEIKKMFTERGLSPETCIEENTVPIEPTSPAELKMPETWVARDYQQPIIDYTVADGWRKVNETNTGGGKTSMALKAGELIGKKLLVVVLGRYVTKWEMDVAENYSLPIEEIITIRGAKELTNVMKEIQKDKNAYSDLNVFITTINTMVDYINIYKALPKDLRDGMVAPEDITKYLDVGYRITDEVHQHFHMNFKIDLFTHGVKSLYLSATLHPGKKQMQKLYEIMWPTSQRVGGGKYDRYIDVMAIGYSFADDWKLQFIAKQPMYSHTGFEKWLMGKKQKKTLENYFELIDTIFHNEYVKERLEGQKCLLFFATVAMCELYRARLDEKYPDLKIRKYTSVDDYSNLIESDVTVSTLGSSGTAVDIIGLKTCIMTTSIQSQQANLQALGRTRPLKNWPHLNPKFIYLFSYSLPKQITYHNDKMKLFSNRVKSHHVITVNKLI